MYLKPARCIVVLSLYFFFGPSVWSADVLQPEDLRKRLGIVEDKLPSDKALARISVAILDNGFQGYDAGKGLLPESTELIRGPGNDFAPTAHGLKMAQIIWAVTGKKSAGPKFYLVNTNGFTNFKAAVDFVIEKKVDIVLYSQVWEFGGNYDGKGFINAEVSRAIDADILWVNAAGDFGGNVYNGSVLTDLSSSDKTTLKPRGRTSLKFVNKFDENNVTLTLSWSDFKDSKDHSTVKDLDLLVFDSEKKQVGASQLRQIGEAPPNEESDLSSHAREQVVLKNLERGVYYVRIVAKSQNFKSKDKYRLAIYGNKPGSITFSDHSDGQEIFPPADHPEVLTVGDGDETTSKGPTADGRKKPDVIIQDSKVSFSNGSGATGSSTVAALMAAKVVFLKIKDPDLTQAKLLQQERGTTFASIQTGGIGGTGTPQPGELVQLISADPLLIPPDLIGLIPLGSQPFFHPNGHLVIVVPGDPFAMPWVRRLGVQRLNEDDFLAYSTWTKTWSAVPAKFRHVIRPPLVEFTPAGEPIASQN
ncbi:hypothetical protein K2X30_09370 [bacterium]|nr:hypothetical protein [bacterium]